MTERKPGWRGVAGRAGVNEYARFLATAQETENTLMVGLQSWLGFAGALTGTYISAREATGKYNCSHQNIRKDIMGEKTFAPPLFS